MGTLLHAESRHLYSWWWDSHVSPKNSKWLQENLTGINDKVKLMIKLIEEDADSFARRAEMYYEKRPELIKLVEEFYRAYRALAERYDHAIGDLRQAQRTMAEAFPNQIPISVADESVAGASSLELQPHMSDMSHLVQAEDVSKLKDEISIVAVRLNSAEDRCIQLDQANKSLKSEMDALVQKMKMQQQELEIKDNELEVLNMCIQDQHRQLEQSEAALKSLKCSSFQSLEEKRHLGDAKLTKQGLECEGQQVKESSPSKEQRFSPGVLIKNLQDEASSLKKMKTMLEEEVQHCIHQKNALQEDLDHLKDEKDDLQSRYQDIMEQVESVGFSASSLQLSIKDLQDENLKLKELFQQSNEEKVTLLEKLEDMDRLSKENMYLEKSLFDSNDELGRLKETFRTLNESHHSLFNEKSELKENFQKSNDEKLVLLEKLGDMENLLEKKRLLENSLSDMSAQFEVMRTTIKTLEDTYHSLMLENTELKENFQKVKDENAVILEKLENVDNLLEKNTLLENCLSDASAESQGLRANLKTLGESFHFLQKEKMDLKRICQKIDDDKLLLLQKLESMDKLSEENIILENSLSDASAKLQDLSTKLKIGEESLQFLQDENSSLVFEKERLCTKLKAVEELIQSLQEENSNLVNEKEGLATELKAVEVSFLSVQEQKSNLVFEKEQLITKLKTIEDSFQCLQEEKCSLVFENEGLSTKLKVTEESLKSVQEEKSNLVAEKDLLSTKLNVVEESIQSLQNEKSNLLIEKEGLITKLITVEESCQSLEEVKSNLTCQVEGLSTKLKSVEESFQFAQEEKSNLVVEKDKLISELITVQKSLESLQGEKSNLAFEKEELSTKLKMVEDSLQSLQEEKSDLVFEKEELSTKLKIVEKSLQSLQEEKSDLVSERAELSTRLKTMEESNQYLQEEKSKISLEWERMSAMLKTVEESFQSLQEEKFNLVIEKDGLSMKLKAVEESFQFLQEEKSNLLLEKEGLSIKSKELEESFQSVQEEKANLFLEKEGLITKLKELEESFQSLQEEKSSLVFEKDMLVSQVESITQDMGKLLLKNAQLRDSLSSMNVELEELRETSNTLEECCRSLQDENSRLLTERHDMKCHVDSITNELEEFSGKNAHLKGSLSYVNAKLEVLREKLNSVRKCYQFLQDEKTRLLSERNDQISLVESCILSMLDHEKKHIDLENKYSTLEKVRDSYLHRVDELQALLDAERQQHANCIQSSKAECAILEKQLHILQEEVQMRTKEFEDEQGKVLKAQIEIVVLMACISHIRERNSTLSVECQTHIDASKQSKDMILELEKENNWQREKVESLLQQSHRMKMVIYEVLKVLHISIDDVCLESIEEQTLVAHILGNIKSLQKSALNVEDDKQVLVFEKSVCNTLLEQVRLEACKLKTKNDALVRESEHMNEKFSIIQSENHALLKKIRQLILDEKASARRVKEQNIVMEKLHGEISNLKVACGELQGENCKLLDRSVSLVRIVGDRQNENLILQEENDSILNEAISHANLSSIFESISVEKVAELKLLNDDFNCLCGYNSRLEIEMKQMVEKVEAIETENMHHKESIAKLEEYRSRTLILTNELNIVRNLNDQMNHQIEIGKNLLSHKEVTLLDIGQKLEAVQSENVELRKEIQDWRILEEQLESEVLKKANEVEIWERENAELLKERIVMENRFETELLKKLNEVNLLERRNGDLLKAIEEQKEQLDSDLLTKINEVQIWERNNAHLLKEIEGHIVREEQLESELLQKTNEVQCWERSNADLSKEIEEHISREEHLESELQKKINEVLLCERSNADLLKEIEENSVREEHLESEIQKKSNEVQLWEGRSTDLQKEIKKLVYQEEYLESELLKKFNEVEILEGEFIVLYEDLQVHTICASIYVNKALEGIAAWEDLERSVTIKESMSIDRMGLLNSDISELKWKVSVLEGENSSLKAEIAEYLPRLSLLMESLTSLEHHVLSHTNIAEIGYQQLQGASVETFQDASVENFLDAYVEIFEDASVEMPSQNETSYQELSENHVTLAESDALDLQKLQANIQADASVEINCQTAVSNEDQSGNYDGPVGTGILELEKLQAKVHAMEQVVMEAMTFAMLGRSTVKAPWEIAIDEATEHIETGTVLPLKEDKPREDLDLKRDENVSLPQCVLAMKDIQLDHVSDSSSHGNSLHGINQRQIGETEDQMLELWEAAEHCCKSLSVQELPTSIANEECQQMEAVQELNIEHPSLQLEAEKEVVVDQPEASKEDRKPKEEYAMMMERLECDAQRLLNLKKCVEELKVKVDKLGMSNCLSGLEYDSTKGQIKEVEEVIVQLVDINKGMRNNARDGDSSDDMVGNSMKDNRNVPNQLLVEQVQTSSEKITKLELELQRIQSILPKLDDQNGSSGTMVNERTTVVLKDYIYGRQRSQRNKKARYCACIRPKTTDDSP